MKMFLCVTSSTRNDFASITHNIRNSTEFQNIRSAMTGTNWNPKTMKCFVTIFVDFDGDLANVEQVIIDENSLNYFFDEAGLEYRISTEKYIEPYD